MIEVVHILDFIVVSQVGDGPEADASHTESHQDHASQAHRQNFSFQ